MAGGQFDKPLTTGQIAAKLDELFSTSKAIPRRERVAILDCIRCGGCCLSSPCIFAQEQYGLNKDNKVCPDLIQNEDGTYTCLMMWRDKGVRHTMLGRGCFYPEYRIEAVLEVVG